MAGLLKAAFQARSARLFRPHVAFVQLSANNIFSPIQLPWRFAGSNGNGNMLARRREVVQEALQACSWLSRRAIATDEKPGWPYRNKPDRHGKYHKRRPSRKEKGSYRSPYVMDAIQKSAVHVSAEKNWFNWSDKVMPVIEEEEAQDDPYLQGRSADDQGPGSSKHGANMNEAGAAETDTGGEKEGTESQAGVEADSEPSIPDLGEEFLSPESEGEGGRRMDVTMRLVLEPGMRQDHPLNKKVETEFHIDDFSKEFGLSSTGKSFVADVCGKRYNERTGIVRLVSERYELREDNFRDLQDKIARLGEEGRAYENEVDAGST